MNPHPISHFDCHCYPGRHLDMREGQPETAEQLLAVMDHFGIHEALVLDTLSASTNLIEGNRRVIRRTRPHPRLHPAWALLMTHSRETPPPDGAVQQMREEGVGAVTFFYGQFQMPLEPWAIGDLLDGPLGRLAVRCGRVAVRRGHRDAGMCVHPLPSRLLHRCRRTRRCRRPRHL